MNPDRTITVLAEAVFHLLDDYGRKQPVGERQFWLDLATQLDRTRFANRQGDPMNHDRLTIPLAQAVLHLLSTAPGTEGHVEARFQALEAIQSALREKVVDLEDQISQLNNIRFPVRFGPPRPTFPPLCISRDCTNAITLLPGQPIPKHCDDCLRLIGGDRLEADGELL